MLNYIERDAALVLESLPDGTDVPDGADELFRLYAVLLRSKGSATQASDVHDAWSAWMTNVNPDHESIKPFAELDAETRSEDGPFLQAIRRAASERSGQGRGKPREL